MARFIKDRSKVKGLIPGSMVLLGSQKMDKPIIRRMRYDADNLSEDEFESLTKAFDGINNKEVTWINIFGLHDMELIEQVGDQFKLPSLLMENVLNTDQRPKYEVGDDYEAFILKMIHFDKLSNELVAEQITIVLGDNYVLSLQEREGDVFNPIRERIRKVKGKVRLQHNDYL
ncbi:MAG: CorA family divalent cation transporter, partial [Bacteroidales bacterium]|nr:CorA family divalent cation transporter [Bacteroidales bacterium]